MVCDNNICTHFNEEVDKNGDLKNALERVLITDEIRKLGKTIEMVVTMSKEQYLDAFSFLYELTRQQEKGNPGLCSLEKDCWC